MTFILACAVCFGAADAATTSGLHAAIATLLGVTAAVLAGVGLFVARFLRRP